MNRFADIYVMQIIGALSCRDYDGKATITIGEFPIEFWFEKGVLQYFNCIKVDTATALKRYAWATAGQIELQPRLLQDGNINTRAILEQIIIDHCPAVADNDMLVDCLTVKQGRVKFFNDCQLFTPALPFLKTLGTREWRLSELDTLHLKDTQNKQIFFFTLALGMLRATYATVVLPVLSEYTDKVLAARRRREGTRIAKAFAANIDRLYRTYWPSTGIVQGLLPPELNPYGTAPYRDWLAIIDKGSEGIGQLKQHRSAIRDALSEMPAQEQAVIVRLSDTGTEQHTR